MPDAQTNARDHRSDPPVTSAPAEDTDGEDTIDYENAQPMPMPSLPDPPPSDNLPIPPAGGGSLGQPGSAPGSYGTGEQNLKVLFPPKSLPDSPLDDITNVEKRKSR
ncbi:MAG: hypothetical protein HOP18_19615 [Deltaproteobacteria bacterium]|nr:hypothetical protein [Deltaproteobacteria bacterium]